MKQVLDSDAYQDLLKELPENATQSQSVGETATVEGTGKGTPYQRPIGWREEATRRITKLRAMIEDWENFDAEWLKDHSEWADQCFFPYRCPKPLPALKVVPKV
jgi:hypothetical protein